MTTVKVNVTYVLIETAIEMLKHFLFCFVWTCKPRHGNVHLWCRWSLSSACPV